MFDHFRDYQIPDAEGNLTIVSLTFFGTRQEEFCANLTRHIADHFLKPQWVRILQISPQKLSELRQKVNRVGVTTEKEVADEVWPILGPILDAGIAFSVGLPVFLDYVQDRAASGKMVEEGSVGYYFLSNEGFIVVVHNNRVRSALFKEDRPNLSRQTVFNIAWDFLRRMKQRHDDAVRRGAELQTRDSKHGQQLEYRELSAISAANWLKCPKV